MRIESQIWASQQQVAGSFGPEGGFWSQLLGNAGNMGSSLVWYGCAQQLGGPDEDGWYRYTNRRPMLGALCVFKQPDHKPWVGYAEFNPEFNIAYLKWKYTGIAKEAGYGV